MNKQGLIKFAQNVLSGRNNRNRICLETHINPHAKKKLKEAE
jgi:hypothetical protein